MTKTYDTAYFIERANKTHGLGVYDYSKSEYVNSKTKVVIICPTHGEFSQAVGNHLEGKGCKACSVQRVKNANGNSTKGLVISGKAVHGDRYDYSKTIYNSSREKSIFICKIHGEFYQTPEAHLNTSGCRSCAIRKVNDGLKITTDEFIARAKAVHGETYLYDRSVMLGIHTKITVTCRLHGDFTQTADSHLSGSGCNDCGNIKIGLSNRLSFDDFLAKATERHGDKYVYHRDTFTQSKSTTRITCRKHGDFHQSASKHSSGDGCPKCGNELIGHGRSKFIEGCNRNNNGKGLLYILKCIDGDSVFYKIGITSKTVEQRYSSSRMPFKYTKEYLLVFSGYFAYDIETRFHSLLSGYRYRPSVKFEGHTECFTTIKPIEQLLKKLSSTEQLQLIA